MQGKNPPAEPGPAGGLRFGARAGAETWETSGRSRDPLYLCVITRSARRRAPAGGWWAMARPGGSLARSPSLPSAPGSWETLRLLIHAGGVAARGETAFPEASSIAAPGPGNTWDGAASGSHSGTEQSSREGYGGRREGGSCGVFPKFFISPVPRGVFFGRESALLVAHGFAEGCWRQGEKRASRCGHGAAESGRPACSPAKGSLLGAGGSPRPCFAWQTPLHTHIKGNKKFPPPSFELREGLSIPARERRTNFGRS